LSSEEVAILLQKEAQSELNLQSAVDVLGLD
jgi:hypothetical protein